MKSGPDAFQHAVRYEELHRSIRDLCLDALQTDGEHHKQWFFEQILDAIGESVQNLHDIHEWDKGIAP